MTKGKIFIAFVLIGLAGFATWLYPQYTVPIMMYHNVDYVRTPGPNAITPKNFERHMHFLKQHGYQVISLDELVEGIKSGRPFFRKSVVITFDDGSIDNYTQAFKILKRYDFPATIFVISDLVGRDGYVTWEQLNEMHSFDIFAGSHTKTHAYLPGTPIEKKELEIVESKKMIEDRLKRQVAYISYPSGGFDEDVKSLVKKAGYKGACTTNRGHQHLNKDIYELKRIRFSDKDDCDLYLWIKLSGYYNLFRQSKDPS